MTFPALLRPIPVGEAGETLVQPEEASCFFHADKRAAASCQRCGLFVCKLCDLVIEDEHICPKCLEGGVQKGKLRDLESHRFLYDRLALSLAVYPLLIFYFTVVTAPVALFVAIRYWNAPRSLVRPRRVYGVLAILFAVLEILGWILLLFFLFEFFRRGTRSR